MSDPIKIAQDRFAQGFNCSQSVFSAFAFQLEIQDDIALKLASPFGGGTAQQGHVCGAVTGALLALGLQKGNATPETKEGTYHLAKEFINRFQELHSPILCRELIGHDISQPSELEQAKVEGVITNICPGLVKDATELVAEFLDE
jgi:C_GCAxxG_C_C family probable redox protein